MCGGTGYSWTRHSERQADQFRTIVACDVCDACALHSVRWCRRKPNDTFASMFCFRSACRIGSATGSGIKTFSRHHGFDVFLQFIETELMVFLAKRRSHVDVYKTCRWNCCSLLRENAVGRLYLSFKWTKRLARFARLNILTVVKQLGHKHNSQLNVGQIYTIMTTKTLKTVLLQ